MRTPGFWRYIAPIVILIVAAIAYASSIHLATRYRWMPVNVPIDLSPGVMRTPTFQVDLATRYAIELAAERNQPLRQLNCLLGLEAGAKDKCEGVTSPIEISWQATENGIVMASGKSSQSGGGSWGPKVGRTIGGFNATPNKDYVIEIRSLKDASILSPAKPHIVVWADAQVFTNHFARASALGIAALAFAAVGGLWLLVLLTRHFLSRRTS